MVDFKRPETWSEPAGGIRYRTTAEVNWGLGSPRSHTRLIIPPGRVFDVSIPLTLRWVFDPHAPRYRLAGLIHDHLLHVDNWTSVRAAGDFHDALRAAGTRPAEALLMYLGVALFRYPYRSTDFGASP
jgi:hypothetical protein